MPQYDSDTLTKIAALRALVLAGTNPAPYELIKINWPAPDGPIYYSVLQTDEVTDPAPPVSPIETRLVPDDDNAEWFMPLSINGSIGDEECDLKFWDGAIDGEGDGAFSDLMVLHGEGIHVEFFYWFPQVELLLKIWEAHLRLEDEADQYFVSVKAVQGFRSAESTAPHRAHWPTCQAVFGGLLPTQAQIDEFKGCPYNFHIGGDIGNNDPDTSEPWTFCPRRTPADCVARDVDPLFHLSHQTQVVTVIGTQSSGGPTFSTSQGNETSLKEPVRVVMGLRRIYDMKVLAFQRHPVTSNPDHGFFEAIYEVSEGPNAQYADMAFTVGNERKALDPVHYSENLGNLGQVAISLPITTHGYSGTGLVRYNFGWIDPGTVDQNDARADGMVRGLRDIKIYREVGPGLVASYYRDTTFDALEGVGIVSNINYPTFFGSPRYGVAPTSFSIRFEGEIQFEFTETYNFEIDHDDSARLVINAVEIINNPDVGIDSDTFDATADAWYPFVLEFVQGVAVGPQPWRCILKWQSSSVEQTIVPASAFQHDAVWTTGSTSNRAWQIQEILTNKRWGFGYDADRLSTSSFKESADFVAQYVRYTDSDGNQFDHYRGLSNVDLQEKKIQQQVEDMAGGGRLSRPFLFNGEIHVVPLRALTEDELADCPVFTDEGDDKNIIVEDEDGVERSTLRWSRKSDLDLKNFVKVTFDDEANNYLETTPRPAEDVDAQLRAGRVTGDNTRKKNPLEKSLLGVTNENQAIKLAWGLLDLGEFDEGGLQNNLRVTFTAWFMDCLEIHPFKVIKVVNSRMNTKYGFEYFRIMEMEREANLHYKITAQAYNVEFMDSFEEVIEAPPPGGGGGGGGGGCTLTIGEITLEDGIISVPIEPC